MKVPYLNRKVESEFEQYLHELKASSDKCLQSAKQDAGVTIFSTIFPLFALLRCLSSSNYARNMSKEIVLTEIKISGTKQRYIDAMKLYNRQHEFSKEQKNGAQRATFTGYFSELFSDLLLFLNSFYTGNYRGSYIALRCMLEDLYRHIYYKDHSQEFWMIRNSNGTTEHDINLSPSKLRDYLKKTSYLSAYKAVGIDFKTKVEPSDYDFFNLNEELYSSCSTAVHGANELSHNLFKSNLDLKYTSSKTKEIEKKASEFSRMAIAFLMATHLDHLLAFDEYEKSLILSGYQKSHRGALRHLLNV